MVLLQENRRLSGLIIGGFRCKKRLIFSQGCLAVALGNGRFLCYNVLMKSKKRKNERIKKFTIAAGLILLPIVGGVISSLITGDSMMEFSKLNQPVLAPPAWLFPIAWTILYILMGVASYLIYKVKTKNQKEKKFRKAELILYFTQLAFNFIWTILFFEFELRYFSFGWLILMWAMILALIIMTFKNSKVAAWCLMPYILWCTFAAYLNIMIAVLN